MSIRDLTAEELKYVSREILAERLAKLQEEHRRLEERIAALDAEAARRAES